MSGFPVGEVAFTELLGISYDGCLYEQITLLIVSMGKKSTYDHSIKLWNLALFSIREVQRFLQLL